MDDVEEEKDLGVVIDKDLKFHRQTASAVKKANTALGLIRKSFAFLDDQMLPLLYKSLVRPHLELFVSIDSNLNFRPISALEISKHILIGPR